MTDEEAIEELLLFTETRSMSPQWAVTFLGDKVATVTLRYIATPPYNIRWADDTDEQVNTRDEVVRLLVERVKGGHYETRS